MGEDVQKYMPVDIVQENATFDGLDVVNLADIYKQGLPDLAPELIQGVLRQGHKMLISAPSKAGKSFALVELAVAIAEGVTWMGFKCRQGRVLYLDLEIDPPSFINRLNKVYEEVEPKRKTANNIDFVNLRGKLSNVNDLVSKVIKQSQKSQYAVIIIDPIYKLTAGGDENNAGEIGEFCNQLDKIASETGASVVFVHHYSKGSQGQKAVIDRASGSGVFGRDPDAIVTMSDLEKSATVANWLNSNYEVIDPLWRDERAKDGKYKAIRQEHIDRVTAWRLEFVLREFATPSPVNVWFRYPVHVVDRAGVLDDVPLVDNSRKGQQEKRFKTDVKILEDTVLSIGKGEPVPASQLCNILNIGSPNTLKKRVNESEKLELFHLDGNKNSPLYVRPLVSASVSL